MHKTGSLAGFYGLPFNNRSAGYGRSDWIRTSDLLVPNETRYQAALRSEDGAHSTEKVLLHKTLRRIFHTPCWPGEAAEACRAV